MLVRYLLTYINERIEVLEMRLQEKLEACSACCQDLNERLVKQSEVINELLDRVEELESNVEWLNEKEDDEDNDEDEDEDISPQEEYNMKVKAIASTAISYSPSPDYAFYLLSSAAANVHALMVEQSKETK